MYSCVYNILIIFVLFRVLSFPEEKSLYPGMTSTLWISWNVYRCVLVLWFCLSPIILFILICYNSIDLIFYSLSLCTTYWLFFIDMNSKLSLNAGVLMEIILVVLLD